MAKYPNNFNSEKSRKRAMRKRTGRKPFSLSSGMQHGRAGASGINVSQMLKDLDGPSLAMRLLAKLTGRKK